MTFYNDVQRTFGNYAISNIGKEHMGIEFGSEFILRRGLTLNAAAAVGRYRYDTRQEAVVTQDNTSGILERGIVYSKDFYLPTPQQAYTVGLNYRSQKYWWVNVSFNYFDDMYTEISPARRTLAAVEGLDPASEKYRSIIDQSKLPSQYTLDALIGWSWLMSNKFKGLHKRTFLVFNVGVSNILDNTNIVSGSYEQLRYDYANHDPDKFPIKSFYAYGRNFLASVALRF